MIWLSEKKPYHSHIYPTCNTHNFLDWLRLIDGGKRISTKFYSSTHTRRHNNSIIQFRFKDRINLLFWTNKRLISTLIIMNVKKIYFSFLEYFSSTKNVLWFIARLYGFLYLYRKETFFRQQFSLVLLTCVFNCSVDIKWVLYGIDWTFWYEKIWHEFFFAFEILILSIFTMFISANVFQ